MGAPEMAWTCTGCGVQQRPTSGPPASCPLCNDERQFVAEGGQQWVLHSTLQRDHDTRVERHEGRLLSLRLDPTFAIGQKAFLVGTSEGNVLWDCLPALTDSLRHLLVASGGVEAIAISHPHFYGSAVDWSEALGGVPVYVHADDRAWFQRPDPCVTFWEGETLRLDGGLTVIRGGGHFAGSSMLHWPDGADGAGALLSSDTIQVTFTPRLVSFMRSFPNLIPLSADAVQRIVAAVEPYAFDRIYGAFREPILSDARRIVKRSMERYLRALSAPPEA